MVETLKTVLGTLLLLLQSRSRLLPVWRKVDRLADPSLGLPAFRAILLSNLRCRLGVSLGQSLMSAQGPDYRRIVLQKYFADWSAQY